MDSNCASLLYAKIQEVCYIRSNPLGTSASFWFACFCVEYALKGNADDDKLQWFTQQQATQPLGLTISLHCLNLRASTCLWNHESRKSSSLLINIVLSCHETSPLRTLCLRAAQPLRSAFSSAISARERTL
jgi:hypothetical protein